MSKILSNFESWTKVKLLIKKKSVAHFYLKTASVLLFDNYWFCKNTLLNSIVTSEEP